MSDQTVSVRANLASNLSTIPLSETVDLAKARVLVALEELGRPADQAAILLLELYGRALKSALEPTGPGPSPTARGPLSGTQLAYLRWAAEGKSSADIAIITGATRRTVDYHFAEILRKLGVASRTQAVAWLAQSDTAARHPEQSAVALSA